MSAQKTVREVRRVYQLVAERMVRNDAAHAAAQQAVVQRLCTPVGVAFGSDPMTIERRLLDSVSGQAYGALLCDELLLWTPPEGVSLGQELLSAKALRKRAIAQQFLQRLQGSTLRSWHVVDAHPGRWAFVHRLGGDDPPRRVELLEGWQSIEKGDCVVARRIKLGTWRVFADGWLAFPDGAVPVLRGSEGAPLLERAFCLWALIALGDQRVLDRWLQTLGASRGERSSGRPPPRGTARTGGAADPERERLLERIRKLFAMAQETEASPHEAEIALRRCQSLMARFGITEADLETSEFAVASVATGRTVATHVKLLGGAVAMLHDAIFVIGRGGLAEFRGYEIDVQVATMTFAYLSEAIERALSSRKQRGELPPGRSAAFDYRVAFADEVRQRVGRLAAERAVAEAQARPGESGGESGGGTSLAVRKQEQVTKAFGADLVSRPLRLRGPLDDEAADAGRRDGRGVSLDPQIG